MVNGACPASKRPRASDLCEDFSNLMIAASFGRNDECFGRNAASFAGNDGNFGRNAECFAGNEEIHVDSIIKSLSQMSICLGYMCENPCCEDSVMLRIDPNALDDTSRAVPPELSGCRDLVLCDRYHYTERSSRVIGRFTVVEWYSMDDPCLQALTLKQPDLHTAPPDQIPSPAPTVSNSLIKSNVKMFSDLPTPRRKPSSQRPRRKPKQKPLEPNLALQGRTVARQRSIRAYLLSQFGPMGSEHAVDPQV